MPLPRLVANALALVACLARVGLAGLLGAPAYGKRLRQVVARGIQRVARWVGGGDYGFPFLGRLVRGREARIAGGGADRRSNDCRMKRWSYFLSF